MRHAIVLLCVLCALPAAAGIEIGANHVIAMPMGDTGELDILTSRGFGAFAEVFWRDAISTRVAATFVNPAAILFPDDPPPTDVDLGTLSLDIYSATVRLHSARRARFSAFAGAGGALVAIGNLEDRFGTDVEIEFDPELTFVAEAGVRYRFRDRIVLELGAMYLPLEAESKILRATDPRIVLPERIAVDPLIVSVGAAWRF